MVIDIEFLKKRPLSYSSLSAFAKSPEHYIHYLTAPRKTTAALMMGSLIDCLVLTPERYESTYVIMPNFDLRKKGQKEAMAEWVEANKGKTHIEQWQLDDARLIRDKIYKNPISAYLLSTKKSVQKQLKWIDKDTGLPMIAYLDLECEAAIADLKSAASADPKEFARASMNWNYPLQDGVYTSGYNAIYHKHPPFYNIVIEKEQPLGVSCLKATADYIEYGKQQFHKLLQEFKYCMEENLFHCSYEFRTPFTMFQNPESGFHQLDLPGWAKSQLEK